MMNYNNRIESLLLLSLNQLREQEREASRSNQVTRSSTFIHRFLVRSFPLSKEVLEGSDRVYQTSDVTTEPDLTLNECYCV